MTDPDSYNPYLNPMSLEEYVGDEAISAMRSRWKEARIDRPFATGALRIALTERCNYACPFCYNEGANGISRALSFDDLRFFIKTCGHYVDRIKLTGGEPLAHREFDRIAQLCADCAPTSMTTNGALLLRHLEAISELESVTVSVQSYDPAGYARLMGTDVPVERVIQNIRIAINEAGVPFQINRVISRGTATDLVRFCQTSIESGISKVNLIGLLQLAEADSTDYVPFAEILTRLSDAFGEPVAATSTRMRFLADSSCPIDVVYQFCTVGCDVCRTDGFIRLAADMSLSHCLAARSTPLAKIVELRDNTGLVKAFESTLMQMGSPDGTAPTIERPRLRRQRRPLQM